MRNRCLLMLSLMAMFTTASAFGQQILKADIPFEFRVGSKVMPAGQYDINLAYGNIPGTLSLGCYECRAMTVAKTVNTGTGQAPTEAKTGIQPVWGHVLPFRGVVTRPQRGKCSAQGQNRTRNRPQRFAGANERGHARPAITPPRGSPNTRTCSGCPTGFPSAIVQSAPRSLQ